MTDQNNKSVFEGIRELTSHISARAAEIEAARRIPLDIVQSLKSAGVFRMFVPRSHGGLELALPTGLETIRALGRVDGSVGWTAMIGSGSALFTALLPRETYDLRWPYAWPKVRWMISSRLPRPDDGNCGLRRRCRTRKYFKLQRRMRG